jgi:hypothetical protein
MQWIALRSVASSEFNQSSTRVAGFVRWGLDGQEALIRSSPFGLPEGLVQESLLFMAPNRHGLTVDSSVVQ